MKITNPATEETVREVTEDTASSVKSKFEAARKGQHEWARRPLSERVSILRKFRESLVKDKEELSKTLSLEVGKPLKQAGNELGGVLGRIDFFLENVERVLKDDTVHASAQDKLEETISHEPLGVIANISAWNYPYFVGSNVFVPALLTGNAVLYKPSEFSTLTGLAIVERLHQAGVPKDVVCSIVGTGTIGAELLKQPINGVFFTGSYGTGKKISEAVGGRMIRTQFELGGKDPIYICDDVDLAATVPGTADGAFYNSGQSCCSVERIYVHEKIYDAYCDAFVKEVRGYVMGDPMDEKTYIGPLTRNQQRDVLEMQVQDAVKKGAKLMCGGKRRSGKGYYFEPTVLTNVNHTMEVMREESFGPIIGIQKVSSDEEALRLMNDTEYGLTAGVYTNDRARAVRILKEVNAGSAYWNCCDRVSPKLPWSGRGHSGLGSTLSTTGILTFVQPKAWHLRG